MEPSVAENRRLTRTIEPPILGPARLKWVALGDRRLRPHRQHLARVSPDPRMPADRARLVGTRHRDVRLAGRGTGREEYRMHQDRHLLLRELRLETCDRSEDRPVPAARGRA